ncbi:MAG: amidohydrolase [Crocinitomicaceae bacterium]|nr:amidohydrolase [Crocinitomicaceae bacterium]
MKSFIFPLFLALIGLISSCMKGESVDLIIHNAKVHTMDDSNSIEDAIAIRDGKIIEVGPEREILNRYKADEFIDAGLKEVYPGLTDAHGHIMSYARQMLSVDLVGSRSYNEMLVRIEKYQSKHDRGFIIGRGWDQSRWKDDEMPTNEKLNELFPDIPVCLFRIDGHALLANDYLIEKSDVLNKVMNDNELSSGGYFIYDSLYNFTGVMVDNAMNPILDMLPDFTEKELSDAIMDIQLELLSYGVTGVHEAGLKHNEVKLIQNLIEKDKLHLNIYGMLMPTPENVEFAEKNGIYQKDNLLIRSFKVYADGALGSRGAFLKEAYTDKNEHHGYLTTSLERIKKIAGICESTGYQMNTHAIGDSTNRLILELYEDIYKVNPDHRWRIEHAQIVDPKDFSLFAQAGVFPSVQPSHATSDQLWAFSRLGEHRMEGAYAYNSLLSQFGMIAIGTDFPVEFTDPFLTIHSAVNRKNSENYPGHGFQPEEAITLEQCMRGMTIWAAFAAFQENELGTIEAGKDATIVMFESPVNAPEVYNTNFAYMTFINGKKVYSVE